jgi:twitching motility two-component system response regulator PilH
VGDLGRRLATIEGQLKGIERLLQAGDTPQAITQSAAARNALESLVRVILQAAITGRFDLAALSEPPDRVFAHALERAMTHWNCSNAWEAQPCPPVADEAELRGAARRQIAAVQDRLRDLSYALEGDNYLSALPELGAMIRRIDELMNLVLCHFIRERMAGKHSSKKARDIFEQAVAHTLKYWHLPDFRVAEPPPVEAGRNILVVDDDPDVVDYVKHILEKHGYGVSVASNPEEAMRKVETEKPALIILDIMMPEGTEGFQFTWSLRSRSEPELRNIPIVVLSSIHETTKMRFYPEQQDGYYGPGEYLPVEGFLDKPVQEETLIQYVERALRVAGRRSDNSAQTIQPRGVNSEDIRQV